MKLSACLSVGLLCLVICQMAPQAVAEPNVIPFWSRISQNRGAVANLGDVNDDGITDFAVGWRYWNDSGLVSVLDGATGLEIFHVTGVYCSGAPRPGWTNFGALITDIGDANMDGVTDFAVSVGDYWHYTGGLSGNRYYGKVYIYSGNPADTTADGKGGLIWEVSSNQLPGGPYPDFGRTIANAGDVNNDGTTDFVVGTGLTSNAATPPGQVFVFDGSKLWDGYNSEDTLYHWSGAWRFGTCVDGDGDVNNDGYDDIVISLGNDYYGTGYIIGQIFVKSGFDGNTLYEVTENPDTDVFGEHAYILGDWNGDGFDDFAFSSPGEDRVYIFYGNNPGVYYANDYDVVIHRPTTGGYYFGNNIAALGDVDGDGSPDLAVATKGTDDSALIIYRGGEENFERPLAMINTGYMTGNEYLAGIGDISGDGYPDLALNRDEADVYIFECSPDWDGDGFMDVHDYCPDIHDTTNADSDGDHVGDTCDVCPGYDDNDDSDFDGWPDGCDNCPNNPNPSQSDVDSDGIGDACDSDNTIAYGFPVGALGGAVIDPSDLEGAGLLVENIGSSGDDGVAVIYNRAEFGVVGVGPVDPSTFPLGSDITMSAVDSAGSPIGVVSLVGGLAGILNFNIDLSPLATSSYTVTAYSGGTQVVEQGGQTGEPFAICNEVINRIFVYSVYQSDITGGAPAAVIGFDAAHTITIPGSSPVTADVIMVVAENGVVYDPDLWPTHSVQLKAKNIPSFYTTGAKIGLFRGRALGVIGKATLVGEEGDDLVGEQGDDLVVTNNLQGLAYGVRAKLGHPQYQPTVKSLGRGTDYYKVSWLDSDTLGSLPIDASVTVSTISPDGLTISSTITKTGSGWQIATDVSAVASSITANFYSGETLLGSVSGLVSTAGLALQMPTTYQGIYEPADSKGGQGSDSWVQRFGWDEPVMVVLEGTGTPLTGNVLELLPEGPTVVYDTAVYAEIVMSDIDTVQLTSMVVQGGCCENRGDIDHSGGEAPIDIADLVYLVDFMFSSGSTPVCFDEGDVDGSGGDTIDISDLVYMVDYMFNSGSEPPACP